MCQTLAGYIFPARENNLAILISLGLMIDPFSKASNMFQHQSKVNLPEGGFMEGWNVPFASVLV